MLGIRSELSLLRSAQICSDSVFLIRIFSKKLALSLPFGVEKILSGSDHFRSDSTQNTRLTAKTSTDWRVTHTSALTHDVAHARKKQLGLLKTRTLAFTHNAGEENYHRLASDMHTGCYTQCGAHQEKHHTFVGAADAPLRLCMSKQDTTNMGVWGLKQP